MSRDITKIKGLPKRIYLVIDDDEDLDIDFVLHRIESEIMWCEDDVYNEGLEYVRIDKVRKIEAENAKLWKFIIRRYSKEETISMTRNTNI